MLLSWNLYSNLPILAIWQVNIDTLKPAVAYIQVTFVKPFFDERELAERRTIFERSNNIRRFVFEMPYTKKGTARSGAVEDQFKRKTILTSKNYKFNLKESDIPRCDEFILALMRVISFPSLASTNNMPYAVLCCGTNKLHFHYFDYISVWLKHKYEGY